MILDDFNLPLEASEALELALGLFGSELATINWLLTPVLGLGHQKPVDLLKTPAGQQQVIELIRRLEYGVGV
ncbi:hypothetical protein D3C80_2156020 [compost metagenome]